MSSAKAPSASSEDLTRLRDLFEESQAVAGVGGWEVDVLNETLYWTPETYHIHEVSPESYHPTLQNALRFYAPESRPQIQEAIAAAINEGKPFSLELQLITGKKRRIWVKTTSKVIRKGGRTIRIYGAFKDITTEKAVDDELRRRQLLLTEAEKLSNTGAWEWDTATDQWSFSDQWLRIHGCKHAASNGSELIEIAHPEDRIRISEAFDKVRKGVAPYDLEHRIIRQDTGEIRLIKARGLYLRDPAGRVRRVYGCVQDVTEQKRAEAALRESEERFRTLADNISQLAWMADSSGSRFWFNKRWYDYTGLRFEQGRGFGWKSVHHPDHVVQFGGRFEEGIRTNREWEATVPVRSSAGEYRWFLIKVVPITDASGRVIRWFGTDTDVHDQKEAAEKLEDALRARDEFISVASHELKTPLSSLKLQAQTLRRGIEKQDPRVYTPARINLLAEQYDRQVRRLVRLVDDMLDVSRIQSGKLTIEKADVSLRTVIKEVTERLKPQMQAANTPVIIEHLDAVEGHWDPFRLEQVVTNLLTNAMKYGRHRPVILRLEDHGDYARLIVRDQGIGIAKENQTRIFNRFERAISANEVSGLGMGLFIAQEIVKLHGGDIWVESELGKGATFLVDLPAGRQKRKESA